MTDESEHKTCEQLIDGELAKLVQEVKSYQKAQSGEYEDDTMCTCGHPYSEHDPDGQYHFCMAELDPVSEDEVDVDDPGICECSQFTPTESPDDMSDPLEALGVEKYFVVKLTLSWGGPADYLEVHIDAEPEGRTITGIYYIYQDWFDEARREVVGDNFDTLAAALEYLTDYIGL